MMTPTAIAFSFFGAGVVFLLAAVRVVIRQRRIFEVIPSSNIAVQLPTKWDDTEITQLLQQHQAQPSVLAHAVTAIKTRMILNQDLKTAQRRLQFMAGVIEVFKLNKEMHGILHDIHLDGKNFEISKVEAEMRMEDAAAKLKSERQLRELRKQRDELSLKKEISQLEQEIKGVGASPNQEPKLSGEQQRRLKRMEIEDKLRELERQETEALKNVRNDEERSRTQNMYSDRRLELEEQLAKNLV